MFPETMPEVRLIEIKKKSSYKNMGDMYENVLINKRLVH